MCVRVFFFFLHFTGFIGMSKHLISFEPTISQSIQLFRDWDGKWYNQIFYYRRPEWVSIYLSIYIFICSTFIIYIHKSKRSRGQDRWFIIITIWIVVIPFGDKYYMFRYSFVKIVCTHAVCETVSKSYMKVSVYCFYSSTRMRSIAKLQKWGILRLAYIRDV